MVCNCTSIGSQLFLLPAKFTIVKRNGTNHIFYHYDNQIYVDCVSPIVADYFYLITAFCFVAMSVSTFATLIHSMTPPFSFFSYLRMVTALEIVVCKSHKLESISLFLCLGILISLILLLTVIVKAEVEEVQRYTEQNKIISSGLSVFLIISSGVLTLNAAVLAQLRQRQIRLTRRVENKRLMCNRPLRSRRDAPPNDFSTQPIAELEHYLLEPGLRRNPSTNTISTTCVEELSTNVDQEDGEETRN